MSTFSSKQEKRHSLIDSYSLIFLVLILGLLLLIPLMGNPYDSIGRVFGFLDRGTSGVAAPENFSLASDQQYWDANCTRGWSPDSACEAIAQRVQSCSISTASAYCSEYEFYLEQFRNR